jgi:hypothetical protein
MDGGQPLAQKPRRFPAALPGMTQEDSARAFPQKARVDGIGIEDRRLIFDQGATSFHAFYLVKFL